MSRYEKMDEMNKNRTKLEKRIGWISPEAFVEWLIVGHGLNETSRNTVLDNLKSQYEAEQIRSNFYSNINIEIKLFGVKLFTIQFIKD